MGGAVFNHAGTLLVRNSTLTGNRAVGGDAPRGVAGAGLGAALFSMNGDVVLEHATLWGNEVANGTGLAQPTIRASGGALYLLELCGAGVGACPSTPQTATVRASLLGGTSGGDDVTSDGLRTGQFSTDHASIIQSGWTGSGTPRNLDPLLGALTDNGGPTPTLLPRHGSPAIDAVACEPDIRQDQRGASRPDPESRSTTPCDVGALEVGGVQEP
jgi:hypothetical protein